MTQIHKTFKTQDIKSLLERYINKRIKRKYVEEIINIRKRQFFNLLQEYRENPDNFSIEYSRKYYKKFSLSEENIIKKELESSFNQIINLKKKPNCLNFSEIKDHLKHIHNIDISLTTIIKRATQYNFHRPNKKVSSEFSLRSY